MANMDNLLKGKATQFKTGDKQAIIAQEGGIASGIAKRARKTIKENLEDAIEILTQNLRNNAVLNGDLIEEDKIRRVGGIAYRLIELSTDIKSEVALKAIGEIIDRIDGKAVQQTKLTGGDGETLFANYSVSPATEAATLKAKKERKKIDE